MIRPVSGGMLAALLLPLAVSAQQAGADAAAATITEADYLRRVGIIAHDSMAGRDTPSPGLDETAAWIASEFRRFGLRSGVPDGSFIQRYPLPMLLVDKQGSALRGGPRPLTYGRDLVPIMAAGVGGEVTGGLIVVSGSRDPARALTADAVRGQHALVVVGRSATVVDQATFQRVIALRDLGAASVMVTTELGDIDWTENSFYALRPTTPRDAGSRPREPFLPLLLIRTGAARDLVRGRNIDLVALQDRFGETLRVERVPGLTLTLTQRFLGEEVRAPNVVGILEGSDPSLRGEYVVFSAHMDGHGFTSPDAAGDTILNGADDDASGTIAVVEIAQAMASLPTRPRRSMVFLLVSGEEKGLWGSEYFAENPSVPTDRMVADLNTDMIGRNWPDTIVAIGKEHSDLGVTLERVNALHPELGMTAIDDLWPTQRYYERSDHYNFAQKGVPILFFFNGVHEDYHGRDDEPDRIDGEKAARITRLVFYLGLEVANTQARPVWNPDSYARVVGRGGR